jgi:DNA-directed RNA polymerase I, II, and III subunit RPABC2
MSKTYEDEEDYDLADEEEEEDGGNENKGVGEKDIADEAASEAGTVASSDNDDEDMGDDMEEDEFAMEIAAESDPAVLNNRFPQLDDLDEDDDDDDYDDQYLQKLDESLKRNIVADWHPELQSHNYEEIESSSRVVRDGNGVIIDPLHKTVPFITRYEKAKILGERAKQINAGAKIFVEVDENVVDGYLIALQEYREKKIPFIIKRPLPNGGSEYWKFKDLEMLD